MSPLALLEQVTASAGGGVALVFIVALILGIVCLMGVYVASAIVVLERFARVARRPATRVVAGAAVGAVAALLWVDATRPELASAGAASLGRAWLGALPVALAATAVATVGTGWLLGRLRPVDVAWGAGLYVALGASLALAGTGQATLAAGLAAPPAAVWLLARWRRRRGRPAPDVEAFAGRCTVLLVVGASLALLPPPVALRIGQAGGVLLAAFGAAVALGLLPLAVAGFLDMRGSAEWFIAARYLVAKRRQVFISAITAICVLGIAAGVWLIIVVLSVMNGFEQTWRDEILGDRAHFVVLRDDGPIEDWTTVLERVRAVPGVVAAAPYIDADAMVRGQAGDIYSLRLRGLDPVAVGDVNRLRERMIAGSLDDVLRAATPPGGDRDAPGRPEDADGADEDGPTRPGIVVGNQLAASLGIGVGDRLLLISPMGGPPTPLGPAPRIDRFEVVGLFRSSFYQYDEVYAYVSIPTAQAFRRAGPVIDGIEAVTTDYYRSGQVGASVAEALGAPFRIRDWKEYFPAFFQALKTERVMMGVLLAMIMVVAAFIIVATLVMMIMEKSGDIAILKAMGARDALVERIFALEGTMIGLLGTLLGVAAGLAVTHRLGWIQDQIEGLTGVDALPSSVYQLSSLPSRVDPIQVAVVVMLAMILSLGATLAPSRQGARIDPAEGLRHE
jgi:lipoprotein-releasing system permease protein